ncbi:hormone-sensitive lipase-like isoform X2 [Paramacrobiotus metropolitanus]|uniref:hormone-sensitive lipase-like isoform X2 n=1 Tax=Paramacrobiotus metropolitanus TaxID=2943436 RepID=UPI0024456742|nr:hormone-sensitive lipase-like isoform X2 [Paramacrobiotus metropolitanus]
MTLNYNSAKTAGAPGNPSTIPPLVRLSPEQEADAIMRTSVVWFCALRSLRTSVSSNLESIADSLSPLERPKNRFYKSFASLNEQLDQLEPLIEKLSKHKHRFDFGQVPANGFRSLLSVTDACLCHLVGTSRTVEIQKDSILFRKNTYLKELEEYTKVLGGLHRMLMYAEKILDQSDQKGSMFPKDGSKLIEEWFRDVETLNQEVFYGRSLGFQFAPSIHTTLQTIALAMAVCAETYRTWEEWKPGSAKLATTMPNMFSTTKFIINPRLRARKIVHTTRNADINFCKQFWGLTEASYLQSGFNWILPTVAVNKVFEIPPELIYVADRDGKDIPVKPALTDRPVYARLISDTAYDRRVNGAPEALSPCLLFHCHGGGFIAQSSKAHEVYLLKWAKDLQIPIFSIDYALAPEYPYPKGLDDVVYAYAWALKNAKQLGWTGERVCFVGDSAGANLIVGAALKIALKNLKPPDGIVAAYGAYLVQYTPSPSRLMSLMDPILPLGVLTRCLAAYAGISEPTCVGQVQGANDKVESNTALPKSPGPFRAAENEIGDAPGNLRTTSSSTANLLDSDRSPNNTAEKDMGDQIQQIPKTAENELKPDTKTSRWFGKGIATLFNKIRAKPMEIINEDTPVDPESSQPIEEERNIQRTDRVPPLPRFNFAAVSVEDPFLSPLLAEDHILQHLPPIYLMACHLDPLLDDSVTFARRLLYMKKSVHLDVMNHLPHGFLNFSLLSTEAANATDLCAKRIRQVLNLDTDESKESLK